MSSVGGPPKIPIDPNGNLATKTEGTDVWTYTWNAENQLTKVEKNGGEVARLAYDSKGRRVEKIAGGVTSTYTYDGEDILRVVQGGVAIRYVHGPGADEPLAVESEPIGLTYYHADALGSIAKATDANGDLTATRRYDAWGNLQAGSDQSSGYAFTGREWDPETGLCYYRARYYEPKVGRFISEDPIGLKGGNNFYAYVRNQPTRLTDPFGLSACPPKPPEKCTVLCWTLMIGGSVFWCDGGRTLDRRGQTCCPDAEGFFDLTGAVRAGRCIGVCAFDCSEFAGAWGEA